MNFQRLLNDLSESERSLAKFIWKNRADFFSWPTYSLLLWKKCKPRPRHKYPETLKCMIKAFKVDIDQKSNGPARMSYLMAGGELKRTGHGKIWEIHHIYDGKFPLDANGIRTCANKNGIYFTEAACLVACHPIAHQAAHSFAYIAWKLRYKAYKKYGFDPDEVFRFRLAPRKLTKIKIR